MGICFSKSEGQREVVLSQLHVPEAQEVNRALDDQAQSHEAPHPVLAHDKENDMNVEHDKSSELKEEGPRDKMFIKTITEKKAYIDFDEKESIAALKKKIQQNEGIPVDQQRLLYKGKELLDTNTMTFYRIEKDTTIQLVVKRKK